MFQEMQMIFQKPSAELVLFDKIFIIEFISSIGELTLSKHQKVLQHIMHTVYQELQFGWLRELYQ
jgi:hypothetical protein